MNPSPNDKLHSITLKRNGYKDYTFNNLSLNTISQYTYLTKVQQADDVIITLYSKDYYDLFNDICFNQIKYRVLKGEHPTVRFK